jgi:hypothetical protein
VACAAEEGVMIPVGSHFWTMSGHSPTDIYYDARMPHVAVETGFVIRDGVKRGGYTSYAWNAYIEGFTPATRHLRPELIVEAGQTVPYG